MDASIALITRRLCVGPQEAAPPKPKEKVKQSDLPVARETVAAGPAVLTDRSKVQADYEKLIGRIKDGNDDQVVALIDVLVKEKGIPHLYMLGQLALQQYQYELARFVFAHSLAYLEALSASTIDERLLKAACLAQFGLYDKAIAEYKGLLKEPLPDSQRPMVMLGLAQTYYGLMMFQAAEGIAIEIVRAIPDCLEGWFLLYNTARQTNNKEQMAEAKQAIEAAAARDGLLRLRLLPFQETPELMFEYACIKYEECQYDYAEQLFSFVLKNGDQETKRAAVVYLMKTYQTGQKLGKLKELAEIAVQEGFYLEAYGIRASIAISESVSPEARRNPELSTAKMAEADEYMAQAGRLIQDQVAAFPTIPNVLILLEDGIFRQSDIDQNITEYLQQIKTNLPAEARAFRQLIERWQLLAVIHMSAVTRSPQPYGELAVVYRSPDCFPGTSQAVFPSLPVLQAEELLRQPDQYELKYPVKDRAKLFGLLEKFAQARGLDARLVDSVQAINLLVDFTLETVKEYQESPLADENCTPIEEKIARGDFDKAVCRNYTMIFLAMFKELKAHNGSLANIVAISDYGKSHTFITLAAITSQGLVVTSIDPTWADDGAPLETNPENLGLAATLSRLLLAHELEKSLAMVGEHLVTAGEDEYVFKLQLLSNLFVSADQAGMLNSDSAEWIRIKVEQLLFEIPLDSDNAVLRAQANYLLGRVAFCQQEFRAAHQYFFEALKMAEHGLSPELSMEIETLIIQCLDCQGETETLLKLAESYLADGRLFSVVGKKGALVSPIVRYLPDGTKIELNINNQAYLTKVVKGRIVWPKPLAEYKDQIEGRSFLVRIIPRS
ncbi:hypothetical protein A2311_05725 [candidate division WOR-1 bacterium RIFOXYB2_FULL_48_7]|uniref:Uncharacterized protein n=1 Tax=candidate division WOR-1 bacterium RIFOXYB2_FULL_48_7 TaxID=1802583 RepID=A0A1F4TUJ0_UNCSA|nr:MAG: hypothetical protein A2311_05725 [candidate division WOR-1 bacterium RIFOXYB2_FULL_48_7]